MRRGFSRRSRRRASMLAAALAAGGTLAGCGSASPAALVQKACSDVSQSIALFHHAADERGAAATRTRNKALVDLRRALKPAALAGSNGGQYQALQATLSESSRVGESQLVGALRAQCAAARSSAG